MHAVRLLLPAAAAALMATPAIAEPRAHPLKFFEGRTEGSGVVKIVTKKAYRSSSVGRGRILPDGSLSLVQRVVEDGRPPRERVWKIRQISPRRFSGTMSEALGPVAIDEVAGRYRFRFRMKGNLSVEQWLVPLAGGIAARNSMRVRKFGVVVGTSEGMIRKIAGR